MRERDRSSVVTELLDRSWGLFADDCLLYQPVKSDNDISLLQNDLIKLEEWQNTGL